MFCKFLEIGESQVALKDVQSKMTVKVKEKPLEKREKTDNIRHF
jgi:hypothetical protein